MNPRQREILEQVVEVLRRRLAPRRIYLFGSRAAGRNDEHSDYDLAVEDARPDGTTRRLVAEELDVIAGLYHVDVVYLDTVEEDFRGLVLKTGKVIYERRPGTGPEETRAGGGKTT